MYFINYKQILQEKNKLDEKIRILERKLQRCPEGKLIITRSGKYHKYYQSDGHKLTYIPKKERQLAQKLAAKKYFSIQMEKLVQEKRAIEFYLRHYNVSIEQLEEEFVRRVCSNISISRTSFTIFCAIITGTFRLDEILIS